MEKTAKAQAASVMVVDDDDFSHAIFGKRLQELGIDKIHVAGNGRQAGRLLDSLAQAPDFLICDIFMPDMDGIEFIAELARRDYRGGLILVTGGDPAMLEVAAEIASMRGLRLLGSYGKPMALTQLRQALGLAAD